ncbi:MAG: hypothetical protein KC731_24025, partial [Myxococcales bacterium]|nr:hypothetical protein [Myxococcales bacterium]
QAALRAKLYLDAVEPDLVFVTVSATMQFLLDDKEARRFVEIDGTPVKCGADLLRRLGAAPKGSAVLAKVRRGEHERFVGIPIPR